MEIQDIARVAFALVAVIGMIGLFGVGARKLGFASGAFALARDRRLAVVEVLPLDARRKMAIVRCDGREHLLVLNPNSVTIVERGVEKGAAKGLVRETEADPARSVETEADPSAPDASPAIGAAAPGLAAMAPASLLRRLKAPLRRAEARPAQ